jgi:hypothetical protein
MIQSAFFCLSESRVAAIVAVANLICGGGIFLIGSAEIIRFL